jgi:F-type H+-transporting ATPase subunit delta
MSELTVASRYAKSLIDLAGEQKLVEKIKEDMDLFYDTLKANPELKAVLANPIVSQQKKTKILEEIFEKRVNKVTIAFFKLMIGKGRGEVLYFTAGEYVHLYDIANNIIGARVVTATPLSAANKKTLAADIEKATGGSVKLEVKVDPALIGGFVLTVGDRQVDTSIASDLNKLKKEFARRVTTN